MRRLAAAISILGLLATATYAASPVILSPSLVDRPTSTAAGVGFTAPRAWKLDSAGPLIQLVPPEGDVRLAIVDVGLAPDASAAAKAAWTLYHSGSIRPVKLVSQGSARNGWDERQVIDYEVSPNEHVTAEAVALRRGKAWTVLITEGSQATTEKRSGAIQLVSQSLRPTGYTRESFAGRTAHQLDAARIARVRSFIETSMRELGIPGVGWALIDHGRVVFEGGSGVRELGKPEPVDAHTLFMIASNTKGMSTLLLARLVDSGKLQWDEPVTQAYPEFRLGSGSVTRKVLIRHLVCACTGLPRTDYQWIFNTPRDTPATTTFTQLAGTQTTSNFGEVFQYNNLMASAAGYIGGHLVHPELELGAAYDAAMSEMIFGPLRMNDTTFDSTRAFTLDHASPHGTDIDGLPRVAANEPEYIIAPYRPAGGAWSSAHDMARYVQNELDLGILPNGTRLVSKANLLKRREPNVPIGEDASYGMGLEIDNTWGVTVVHHGGSMLGFKSDWIALPDAGVGAVLLTNADDGGALTRPFMRRLLEIVYDGKPEAAGDVAAAAQRLRAGRAAERPRLLVPPAPEAAQRLATAYFNADLGPLTIRHDGDQLILRSAAWSTHLASRRNADGTMSFVGTDPALLGFVFVVGGTPERPTLTTRDGQHEYVFTAVR